jgi:hypothetical protein
MKEFHSLAAFGEHLAEIAVLEEVFIKKAVSHCAKLVEKEAKAEIGTYQEQAGPFIAWPELAESTKSDRVNQGYPEDEPLLRTGEMRDSIGTTISTDGMEAQIGSNDDKAVWQELGTEHIPPRSFLGGAMVRKLPEIKETLGRAVYSALIGEKVHNGALLIED